MQELQVSFSSRYSTYAQLERQGDIVMYRRFPRTAGHATYEVAVISVEPAHVSAAGFAIDDTETYPDESALGHTLWRFDSLHDAQQQFKRLCTMASQPATDQPAPVVVVRAAPQEDAAESRTP